MIHLDFTKFSWVSNYRNCNIVICVIPVDFVLILTGILAVLKHQLVIDTSWWIVFSPIIISIVYPVVKAFIIGLFFGVIESVVLAKYRKR